MSLTLSSFKLLPSYFTIFIWGTKQKKCEFMFTKYFDQENDFIKLIYTYSKLTQMNNVYCHFVKFY